jgi:uncharacterized membrane protein
MFAFLSLGRWIFPISFALLGLVHFMNVDRLVAQMPAYLPLPSALVYLSGIGLVAAAVSMLIEKYDKLAATLLGIQLLFFVLLLHLEGAMTGQDGSMSILLKDLAMAGAALIYAKHIAKDSSFMQ